MRRLGLIAMVCMLSLPLAAAHHIHNESVTADCPLVAPLTRSCNVLVRHQVTVEPCDEDGCVLHHECVLELSGTRAEASGMCGAQPWALATTYGFVSTYRDDGVVFLSYGGCASFTATGSGEGLTGLPTEPTRTGEISHTHVVCI